MGEISPVRSPHLNDTFEELLALIYELDVEKERSKNERLVRDYRGSLRRDDKRSGDLGSVLEET